MFRRFRFGSKEQSLSGVEVAEAKVIVVNVDKWKISNCHMVWNYVRNQQPVTPRKLSVTEP